MGEDIARTTYTIIAISFAVPLFIIFCVCRGIKSSTRSINHSTALLGSSVLSSANLAAPKTNIVIGGGSGSGGNNNVTNVTNVTNVNNVNNVNNVSSSDHLFMNSNKHNTHNNYNNPTPNYNFNQQPNNFAQPPPSGQNTNYPTGNGYSKF
jgi:hypothetical protein